MEDHKKGVATKAIETRVKQSEQRPFTNITEQNEDLFEEYMDFDD